MQSLVVPYLVVGVVVGVWYLAKLKRERAAAEKKRLFEMIDDIISEDLECVQSFFGEYCCFCAEILKKHCEAEAKKGREGSRQEALPVPTIHDMIIPPSDRYISHRIDVFSILCLYF